MPPASRSRVSPSPSETAAGFPVIPNDALKPERVRSFEAGFEQKFSQNYSLTGTYFNGLFRDKIDFNFMTGAACPPPSAVLRTVCKCQ